MLEDAKRGVAKAMRTFADASSFPVLIHCIHGKDRTGSPLFTPRLIQFEGDCDTT